MKKVIVIILLLISASSVFAQEYGRFGVGVNGSYFVWKGYNAAGDFTDHETSFTIGAAFSVMLTPDIELRPFLTYGSMKYEELEIQTDGSFTIGGGVGAYWHMLKLDHLRMGPGASFDFSGIFDTFPDSDTATTIIPSFKVPMMLEFIMTKNFLFRLEYTMFSFHAVFEGTNTDAYDNYTYFMIFPTEPANYTSIVLGSQILNLGLTFRF